MTGVVRIFGLDFYSGTIDDLAVEMLIGCNKFNCLNVATPNSDFIVRSTKDHQFLKILNDMDLLVVDGMPLIWANRLITFFGKSNDRLNRIAGSDLTKVLAIKGVMSGCRIAFFGGGVGVADAAKKAIIKKTDCHEDLILTICPEFGFESDVGLSLEYTSFISEFKPHFLFVAVGSPKQERWVFDNASNLKYGYSIGVGASLDFIGGLKKRAPLWIQSIGGEWLYRLAQEPKRLVGRYVSLIVPFSLIFMKEVWGGLKK